MYIKNQSIFTKIFFLTQSVYIGLTVSLLDPHEFIARIKNPDDLAQQQNSSTLAQQSQLIQRSPPEQEHSPQVIIIMATIIIIKIICAFWMCIVVCLCALSAET